MPARLERTPYSTVLPFVVEEGPNWIPQEDRERMNSYIAFEDMYWNNPDTFEIVLRGDEENPLYVPKPRVICDVTSHYFLKGLKISVDDPEKNKELTEFLKAFLKREKFYSRFHVAKHSGVVRGDFVLHITVDEDRPEGSRISLTSVDPSAYFKIEDEDDVDKILGCHLVEQFYDEEAKTYHIKKKTYRYVTVSGNRRVSVEEGIYRQENWDTKPKKLKEIVALHLLPETIDVIPVYHFQNIGWQGRPWGTSELAGFEKILTGINQTATDEELALALEGLGVYATDAGRPEDEDTGEETDWEIYPGRVMEVPFGAYFRRVEGISTITPMQDHLKWLEHVLNEGSGTSDVALGNVDVNTAESGIALAIKFMPTLAKLEERDYDSLEGLMQLWYDWKKWWNTYEEIEIDLDIDILATIGEKLPANRTTTLNELNNMFDREIISAQFYRSEMQKLGYVFPDDIVQQIQKEQDLKIELARKRFEATGGLQKAGEEEGEDKGQSNGQVTTVPQPSKARNKERPNETGGTEATQKTERQVRVKS